MFCFHSLVFEISKQCAFVWQVLQMPNVFAAGDCTSTVEEKTAFTADLSAALAARNIIRLSEGRTDLLTYPESSAHGPIPEITDLSLYKYDGVLQVKRIVVTGIPAAMSKLMVESIQLMLAREWRIVIYLWSWIEYMMVQTARWI